MVTLSQLLEREGKSVLSQEDRVAQALFRQELQDIDRAERSEVDKDPYSVSPQRRIDKFLQGVDNTCIAISRMGRRDTSKFTLH